MMERQAFRFLLSIYLLSAPGLIASAEGLAATKSGDEGLLPSTDRAMGALPLADATSFRLWAPNAQKVFVSGDFNGWSDNDPSAELAYEGSGMFSADVAQAKAGQRYRFVIRTKDNQTLWRNDPRAQRVENSAGASIIHDHNSYVWKAKDYRTPKFHNQVIYEMHIGTFHDQAGGKPGTWKSAMDKLDYLKDLGVNMLQILPPSEFPGDFSWGYNPSYPYAPESSYGTPDDMKAFVDAAHERGMGVIVDVVHNHHGPSDLPTWCFDGPCYGNGGIYFYTDYRAHTPWGNTRPDYGRKEVRSYIRDSAFMWLDQYRLDGLRFDGTKFMRTLDGGTSGLAEGWNLLRWINDEINHLQPWKILIAEDFGGGDAITRSTSSGGAGFDTQWAGEFVHPLRAALKAPSDADRDLNTVAWSIAQRFNGQANQRVIYTESHDEVANGQQRLPEAIWPNHADSWASKKRSTLGAAITLTSPGIPMLFQGQEFLEDGWFDDKDPVDWNKSERFAGITQMYRDLIRLRRNWYGHTRGLSGDNVNIHHINNLDKVMAYHRWDRGGAGDDVIVVANFSSRTLKDYKIGLPHAGLWRLRFNGDWSDYSADFGNTKSFDVGAHPGAYDGLNQYGIVNSIGPYSVLIFSQ